MSAITGVVQFDASPCRREDILTSLERMAAFREVDDSADWQEGAAGFGFLLERRTPEDRFEQQPLVHEGGRFVFCGDLRLDNRDELAADLGIDRASLARLPDGALALEAWVRWSAAAVDRLLGDFAFAVWDRRERTLFCARDPLGVRPLYYASTGARFACASAIKGLLALPWVTERLDEMAIGDYLVVLEEDLERTFFEDIKRLPAGHSLTLDARGKVRIRRYWNPDPKFELRLGSDAEYAEGLREALRRAVASRMRCNGATGVLLSGGLDSSTLACLAADTAATSNQRIVAVGSVLGEGFEGPERDEWEFMQEVALSRANIDLYPVVEPEAGFLTDLDRALAINDHPFRDIFHYMTRALLQAAMRRGARNVFWGIGGDDFVSSWAPGYPVELFRHGRLLALVREMRARQRREGTPIANQIVGQVMLPLLPRGALRWLQRVRHRGPDELIGKSAINEQFAREIGMPQRLYASRMKEPVRSVREGELASIESRSLSEDLEYAANLGASLGIALHAPLLDRRVVEYCIALPASQKAARGMRRLSLRRAMEGTVPERILLREDKGPFAPDFDRRVTRDRASIQALIDSGAGDARVTRYIDTQKMSETMAARPERQSGFFWETDTLLRIGAGCQLTRFLQLRRP